jgi:hypothetical protein
MEADISILRKTGHFYFALTARRDCFQQDGSALPQGYQDGGEALTNSRIGN